MKRVLGPLFAIALLFGGVACGDDGESGGSGDSGNPDVQAYCDSVDAFVAKANEVGDDPAKAADLASEAQELTAAAADLADVSSDEAQKVSDCTEKATKALQP